MTNETKTIKTRKSYSLEFKQDAVNRVNGSEKIVDVAKDLNINPQILGRWKRELTNDKAGNHQDGRDEAWWAAKVEKMNRDHVLEMQGELVELRQQNRLMRQLISLTICQCD